MEIAVRAAVPGDAAELAAFAARRFRETYLPACAAADVHAYADAAFTPARQAEELADPAGTTLWAEVDGRAAGYAQLRVGAAPPGVPGARPVEVARFYVDAPWHGRGVAAALLDAALRAAAERGGDVAWLAVWERNERAIRFYERRGFRRVGSATFTMGADEQRDHLMARPVAGR
jgi:GNAT superfamily N-acetyltransferase